MLQKEGKITIWTQEEWKHCNWTYGNTLLHILLCSQVVLHMNKIVPSLQIPQIST